MRRFREWRLERLHEALHDARKDLTWDKRFHGAFGGYGADVRRTQRRIDRLEAKIDKFRAALTHSTSCEHDWIDIRNEAVLSGEMCRKCRRLRPGNEATRSTSEEAPGE